MWYFVRCLIALLISFPLMAEDALRFCDDEGGWAPYAYNPVVNGKADTSKIVGAMPDLLDAISQESGLAHTLNYIPWKRCMEEVTHFKPGNKNGYEAFLHATYNEERSKLYYITAPVYRTHMGIFYNSDKHPNVQFKKTSELNGAKICGVAGYNFDMMYAAGLEKKIDLGAKETKNAIEKVITGHCDYFVSSIEIVYGAAATGQFTLPANIKSYILADLPEATFYMFVSKQSPRAYELLTKLNQAIIILENNGKAQEIFKKYLPTGNGL